MQLSECLIIFQSIMVVFTFAFLTYMSCHKMTNDSKYLVFSVFFVMIQNVGYLFELLSKELAQATFALKFEYVGTAFVATFFMLFIANYCKFKISVIFIVIAYIVDIFSLIGVWLYEKTSYFYTYIELNHGKILSYLDIGHGVFFYIFTLLNIIQLILSIVSIINVKIHSKHKQYKRNCMMFLIPITIIIISYIIFFTGITPEFDPIPATISVSCALLGIIIVTGRIFDISTVAHADIIKNTKEAIIITDKNCCFMEANDSALELFKELNNLKMGETMPLEISEMMADGNISYEKIIGNQYYVYYINKVEKNKKLQGYALVLFNMTKERDQLEEMRLLKQKADAANHAKSDFIARMSHEIRTPINVVLGMNEMILRENDNENVEQYALDVRSSANTLLSIINDILDTSKIESGKMEIEPVVYELGKLLHDIVNMFDINITEKQLEFKKLIDPRLPSALYGDDIRIRQVLLNLISNAFKYTREGTVTLKVTGDIEGDYVILKCEVRDTGIGIKPEDIDRLFVSFERIETSKNRNISGTGLGLGIAKNILALMDSELKVESEYGKGSVFYFDLKQRVIDDTPIGKIFAKPKVENVSAKYAAKFVDADKKILVVDDNRLNRKVFVSLVKQTKIKVDEAESGMECLQLITKNKYDMIFMDHMMPDMDGIETFEKMCNMENNLNRGVPVFMLTANATNGAREEYIEHGFNGFLSKPIDTDKLEEILELYLNNNKE